MKLFGTDGVRGVANRDLTPELALALGRAALLLKDERNKAVIGRDTRRSGEMLTAALAAGLASVGIETIDAGVLPTPAIPFLIEKYDASFGAAISASHNPPEDNGIKFFNRDGFKISEELEDRLEEAVSTGIAERPAGPGWIHQAAEAQGFYLGNLLRIGAELRGLNLKLVIDCAHGAVAPIAPQLFARLGCLTVVVCDRPDGENINRGCGSTDLKALQEAVLLYQADLGVAYDGDGDRALFVDHEGNGVDGDAVLLIAALELQRQGRLSPPLVVATVMSNFGLEESLKQHEIELLRTPVGDRYVAEKLEETKALLGGEQSGHTIFREHSTTGDGLITTLELLKIIRRRGSSLAELASGLIRYPQVLHNVPVPEPALFHQHDGLQRKIEKFQAQLDGIGRLVVRPSGTQPLIRVMVEGRDERLVSQIGAELRGLLERELNR
jgi:phosphoglucosamine mutase